MRRQIVQFCIALLIPGYALANTSEGSQSIAAVFDVEVKGLRLELGLTERLADYVANRLAETGRFQIVPREQLKARLVEEKKQSYRECYDQTCQIELGRELAAEKSISIQISKLASKCVVSVVVFDLKRAAPERAANEGGPCDENGIVDSVDRAVNRILGRSDSNQSTAESVLTSEIKEPLPKISICHLPILRLKYRNSGPDRTPSAFEIPGDCIVSAASVKARVHSGGDAPYSLTAVTFELNGEGYNPETTRIAPSQIRGNGTLITWGEGVTKEYSWDLSSLPIANPDGNTNGQVLIDLRGGFRPGRNDISIHTSVGTESWVDAELVLTLAAAQ